VPISRAGISFFTALFIILLIVRYYFYDNTDIKYIFKQKVTISFALFILASFVSLLYSDHWLDGLRYDIKYWYYVPIILIATTLKKEYIPKTISAFLLGMMISEILSYGIFFELWTWKHGNPSDPTPFMNHLQYSMFLTFTSLLLLNRVFFETQIKWKIFYFLYFLTVTSNLFLNGGRTGQIAFILSIFLNDNINIKNKVLHINEIIGLMVGLSVCSGYIENFKYSKVKLSSRVFNDWVSSLRINSHSPHSSAIAFELLINNRS